MSALLGLLLAASIDGETALRHASVLAALGPHPWGSPRNSNPLDIRRQPRRARPYDLEIIGELSLHGVTRSAALPLRVEAGARLPGS